jgi:hypothetical protein
LRRIEVKLPLTMVPIESHFLDDLRQVLCERLHADGYTVESPLSTETLLHNWMKIQRRHIEPKTRQVLWSKELRARLACAPAWQAKGVARVERAVVAGEDLAPFLSRDLRKDRAFKKNDGMLDDFGIHHFHLGEGVDKNGLVTGRAELLYAVVSDDAVHFVEVFDHSRFWDEESFRIAQKNWPHLYERLRLPTPPSRSGGHVTAAQRKTLRGKNGNAPVAGDDGTLFLPPGGGTNTAGFSTWIVRDADVLLDRLQRIEQECRANVELLVHEIVKKKNQPPARLLLRFVGFANERVLVCDDESGVQFSLS